jgi:DNA-3-methyladenine glycosylase II
MDNRLAVITATYGYPPMWTRPNTFSTLVLTILEQQVSLAAAFAAYKKLNLLLPQITPEGILTLEDEALHACYFSRQKISYVKGLASAILEGKLNLQALEQEEDEAIREKMTRFKGIGDWTVDIYLLHALQRADVFPTGDLALVNAIRMIKEEKSIDKQSILAMAEPWRPYRSIATMLFWHYYIKKKNIKLLH